MHNRVPQRKSKKTASSLCPFLPPSAGVLPENLPPLPTPAFRAQPAVASHSILRSSPTAVQLGAFSARAWNWFHFKLFLMSQCLDRHPFPGVCGPLNLVESLPCMDIGLSFQVIGFEQPRDSRDVDTKSSAKIRGAESITQGETQKPLVKAELGSETRKAHWSQGANGAQWQGGGMGQVSRRLARAVWSFQHVSIYLCVECFTVSVRMKLCKHISIVNMINHIIEEGTNYSQKQLGLRLGRPSQRWWQLSWVLEGKEMFAKRANK